jgi:hypothetical protein
MTTETAAALYLAQHLQECENKKWAVYNPHDKPLNELPVIYGFSNGGSKYWWEGRLVSEDGIFLGGHCCSHEAYMPHDLGVLEGARVDRHVGFKEIYPNGYRMEFVKHEAVSAHEKLQQILKDSENEKTDKTDKTDKCAGMGQ